MEIVVKKDELAEKVFDVFKNSLIANAKQQNLDEEEINAHLVINRKKMTEDANNIVNIVFAAYGVNPEQDTAEEVSE